MNEQLSTWTFLENTYQRKRGSIVKGLESQKSLENVQIIKTLAKTYRIFSNHNHQRSKKARNPKGGEQSSDKDKNINISKLNFTQKIDKVLGT